MKKILLCSAALAVFAGPAMADGIYVAGKFGGSNGEANSIHEQSRYVEPATDTNTKSSFTDNVISWGGAVGYEYDKWLIPLRMEAEYLWRNHYNYNTSLNGVSTSALDFNSSVNSQTILANFYADVPITDMFGVFFGGGFGEAINTSTSKMTGTLAATGEAGSVDNAGFSWMTTAGLMVKPLKWMAIDLSYRYSGLGDVSWRTGATSGPQYALETDDFAAQELYLGLRFMIPNMIKKHHKHREVFMDK